MSIATEIRSLTKKYRDAEGYRTRHLERFLGEDGKVPPAKISEHNRAVIDNAHDARTDLRELLSALEEAVGAALKVGDAVTVPADATTADGGFVAFDGEVTAKVVVEEDEDGDVVVELQDLRQYVDSLQLKLVDPDVQV
ncbi:hypothetical protein [Streptomyces parvus]|uniref:hypothetical protein n=1 Tax=Streptomyces parvus TaxID=66428 RepID=UPI003D741AC5